MADEIVSSQIGDYSPDARPEKDSPAEVRAEMLEVIRGEQFHAGPLPSAEQMLLYKSVDPRLPSQIVELAQVALAAQIEDNKSAREESRAEQIAIANINAEGQRLAFAAITLFFLLCYALALLNITAGGWLGAAGVGAVCIAYFVNIARSKR